MLVADIADTTKIAAGSSHSCALLQTGSISCWGNNYENQLGNSQVEGTLASQMPLEVTGITDATAITTGSRHSCALHRDGTISCWGHNAYNQLGNGTNVSSSSPLQVADITDATAITTGSRHSCTLHEGGTISCWGANSSGQLGNGTYGISSSHVQVADITDATAITAGAGHSCALHQTGTISCWGNNYFGQLGNGNDTDSWVPVKVANITDATAITTGWEHSCALHEDGTISCWGNNNYGQLGNGQRGTADIYSWVPVKVADITDATAITAGWWHSCALHEDGTISCWGNNFTGQLGNGTDTRRSWVFAKVADITDASDIAAGWWHSCALHEDGTISCWGRYNFSQLGNREMGYDLESAVPVQIVDITEATAITAGWEHSCALREGGTIYCWGHNQFGQLGNGNNTEVFIPVLVADITDATAINAGGYHSCALQKSGTIHCWGNNLNSQLGDGTDANSWIPVQVADITNAAAINAGGYHSCALHESGTIHCWGNNFAGQQDNRIKLPQFVVGFGG